MALANATNENSTGLQSLNSSGVFNGRTLTGTANQVSVTNGDGTAGNPTIALTSTIFVSGISFDSGSNTLSVYATGTFSPTITNTGSAPTVTYTQQTGRWTNIGNRVILVMQITINAYTAGSGDVNISSIPFTTQSTANNLSTGDVALQLVTFGAAVSYYNLTMANGVSVAAIAGNRTTLTLLNLVAAGINASSTIQSSIVFEV